MNDFWCGIESRFPLCCIIFYCDVWLPLRDSGRMFSGRPECYDWICKKIGYIECQDCVINRLKTK